MFKKVFRKKNDDNNFNILDDAILNRMQQIPVRDVAFDGKYPLFILKNGAFGYLMRLEFLNAKAWNEDMRADLISALEGLFYNPRDSRSINYSFAFYIGRGEYDTSSLDKYYDPKYPVCGIRTDFLKDLAKRLEIQSNNIYFSITAAPSKEYMKNRFDMFRRFKAEYINEDEQFAMEGELISEVFKDFGAKIKAISTMFAEKSIPVHYPKSEKELLKMSRLCWRPNYTPTQGDRDLDEDVYSSPQTYLTRDLRIDQYKTHWVSDGCIHMMFSMEGSPDPRRPFYSSDADSFLNLGVIEGVTIIPYLGQYIVGWNNLTRDEGEKKFKQKVMLKEMTLGREGGLFEDRQARKEAQELREQHDIYSSGDSTMTNASVIYIASFPIHHLGQYFDTKHGDEDIIGQIANMVKTNLEAIGNSEWRLETRTYFPTYMNIVAGTYVMTSSSLNLPKVNLPLDGLLHLVPLYSVFSPDWQYFNGGNYFITEENTIFPFHHFSEAHGEAANFAICGSTGSGKSVTTQVLVENCEKLNPYVMILDFGGGEVGSWTKLCSVMGGIELKFGDVKKPLINPFHLSVMESMPNTRKIKQILSHLKMEYSNENILLVKDMYYFKAKDNKKLEEEVRLHAWIEKYPILKSYDMKGIESLMELKSGYAKPDEKAMFGIRTVMSLLLANDVTENGMTDNPWSVFSNDDVDEAINRVFEEYLPEPKNPNHWPTLSTLKETIARMQEERENAGRPSVVSYHRLMTKLDKYTGDGLEADFIDGQTNVNVTDPKTGETARFILADMAGIKDKRKMAVYMITVNEMMSNVMYNATERGIMIRDEAWLFMKSEIAAPYIDADYRLARKYGFSVVTIAQNYTDFKSTTIQNNTQVWIICKLSDAEAQIASDNRFAFNSTEMALFKDGKMGNKKLIDNYTGQAIDVYSRILIGTKTGKTKYFVKNKISRKELWITTTNPDDTFVFNWFKNNDMRGKHPIEVINFLATGAWRDESKYPRLYADMKLAGRNKSKL